MTSEVIIVPSLLIGVLGGYYVGRYQATLMNKIRTLEGQSRAPLEKPTVTAGAYEPPKEVGTPSKQKAGIVESKTPERLDWEHSVELAELEHDK